MLYFIKIFEFLTPALQKGGVFGQELATLQLLGACSISILETWWSTYKHTIAVWATSPDSFHRRLDAIATLPGTLQSIASVALGFTASGFPLKLLPDMYVYSALLSSHANRNLIEAQINSCCQSPSRNFCCRTYFSSTPPDQGRSPRRLGTL